MNAIVNLDRVDFQCARDGLNNSYEIKLMKMELKIAEFERRRTRAEKNECKCIRKVESFVTHTEKVMLSQKQESNDEIVPNPIEIVDKQSKTATGKKTTRIKSLTYEMASLNRKIDSCEAICDTNLTFCIEIQKQIDDTKCRIADLENNKQTISESQSQTIMSSAIIEIGNAIKRHNNTIKTHLKLSEAYNLDVMEKINNTMHEINKINDNNKHSNQNDNSGLSWKRETVRQSNVIACEIGKVSIRPLYNHQRTCKQIRIHVYDSKCDSICNVTTRKNTWQMHWACTHQRFLRVT